MRKRKKTRQVTAGNLKLGGSAPVVIQSMTNLPLERVRETITQVHKLEEHGAQLVRVAVRNLDSIGNLKKVISGVNIPLSADIHFDYRIAIEAIKAGIAKVRINPGNIGNIKRVQSVISAAKDHGVPIRIGVNGGSLNKKKYPVVNTQAMVESAMEQVKIFEDNDYYDIVVSLKASDSGLTIRANTMFSEIRDYPLHIGLTEAGYGDTCIVQSSVTIGHLLLNGLGDTIRVSMTGDPVNEIAVAKKILESVGEREALFRIIACPTCGRTDPEIDLLKTAKELEDRINQQFLPHLEQYGKTLQIAVMGCEVNGPGEASHADFGLAGAGKGKMIIFSKGRKLQTVTYNNAVESLLLAIDTFLANLKK